MNVKDEPTLMEKAAGTSEWGLSLSPEVSKKIKRNTNFRVRGLCPRVGL
jgi:hypothetical protein